MKKFTDAHGDRTDAEILPLVFSYESLGLQMFVNVMGSADSSAISNTAEKFGEL